MKKTQRTLAEADITTRPREVSPATPRARCALERAIQREGRRQRSLPLSRSAETEVPCASCPLYEAAE